MKQVMKVYAVFLLLVFIIPLIIVGIGGSLKKDSGTTPPSKSGLAGTTIKSFIKNQNKVVEFDIEDYIVGTLAAEMPAAFPTEALKAQAVAIRTYIMKKNENGKPDDEAHKGAIICSDPNHCLAWVSQEEAFAKWSEKERETNWAKLTQAVKDTSGEIIIYDSKPVSAVFYAISGGKTENAKDVWGSDIPYLKSVDSPGDLLAPGYENKTQMTTSEFKDKILSVKPDTDFKGEASLWIGEPTRSEGGAVINIKIGGVDFTGGEIRKIFNIRSSNFKLSVEGDKILFDVLGYGHGVGMSQWGAKYFAEQGKNYKEILLTYYKGVELQKNY